MISYSRKVKYMYADGETKTYIHSYHGIRGLIEKMKDIIEGKDKGL